jgi:hypothetical protein
MLTLVSLVLQIINLVVKQLYTLLKNLNANNNIMKRKHQKPYTAHVLVVYCKLVGEAHGLKNVKIFAQAGLQMLCNKKG